jgi:hypothetical protein
LLSQLAAQEVQPLPIPAIQTPHVNIVPRVRITHHMEVESPGWKEFVHLELTEWSPEKDVLITQFWQDDELVTLRGTRTQVFRTPRRYSEGFRGARRSSWKVEYVDAKIENESRLIIEGLGRRYISRIYGPEDYFRFLWVPSLGWQELGYPARMARRLSAATTPNSSNPP